MTRTVWRMVRTRHAATAFSGEGASIAGGRWNSKGMRMVYASGHRSLAVLETLVHLNPFVPLDYVMFSVEFDEALMERLTPLPKEWRELPVPRSVQKAGDLWGREGRSAVLEVPSVMVPEEKNYLLNPAHSDFQKIVIHPPEPYIFDPRLI